MSLRTRLSALVALLLFSAPACAANNPANIPAVSTRTQMAALYPLSAGMSVYLTEQASAAVQGRQGTFTWRSGDYSAFVTADPDQCAYVTSSHVANTVGAWVRDHTTGIIDVAWCGALYDWTTGVSVPNHVAAQINAAVNLVVAENQDNSRFFGGMVIQPKGTGVFDDSDPQIWIKNGVRLVGQGAYTTVLRWAGTRATVNPIYLGNKDMTAAFACGLKDMTVWDNEDPAQTQSGDVMIYTETCQQGVPILENVYLWGTGGRIMFDAEHGYGGAAELILSGIDANSVAGSGSGPYAENPILKLSYPSAITSLQNVIVAGFTTGGHTNATLIEADTGSVTWNNGECEEATVCVYNALAGADYYLLTLNSVTTGGVITSVVSTSTAQDFHVHTCVFGVSSAASIFVDNRSGGPYNGGSIGAGEVPNTSNLGMLCR